MTFEDHLETAGNLGVLQTLAAERKSYTVREALSPFAETLPGSGVIDEAEMTSALHQAAARGDSRLFLQGVQALLSAVPCWDRISGLCEDNRHLFETAGTTLDDLRDRYRFAFATRHDFTESTLQCMGSSALGRMLVVSINGKAAFFDAEADRVVRVFDDIDEVHWVFMDNQGITWPISRESRSYVGLDTDGNVRGAVDISAKLDGGDVSVCRGCAVGDLHCLIVRINGGYRVAAYHPDSMAEKAFLFPEEQFVAPVCLTGFGGLVYVIDSMGFLHIVDVSRGVEESRLVRCLPMERGVVRLSASERGVFVASSSWVGKMTHDGRWVYRYPMETWGHGSTSMNMMQFSLSVGAEHMVHVSERRSKEMFSFVV